MGAGKAIDWAARIRAARTRAGLRQRDLAARLGVCEDAVQSWETGRRLPRASFHALSAFMGLDAGESTLFRLYCAGREPPTHTVAAEAPRRRSIW